MLTSTEWTDWLAYHGSLFAGFASWASEPEREDGMVAWYGELAPYELDVLRLASVELLRSPDKPHGFTNHLAALLDHCRAIHSRQQAEQSQSIRVCGLCQDAGLLSVRLTHESRMRWRAADGAPVDTGIVACKCTRGERYRPQRRCDCKHADHGYHGYPEFDERFMTPVERVLPSG